jgi:hypothetical protein
MSAVNLSELRARYVADFRAQADRLEAEREAMSGALADGWVVVMPGNIAVRFTVEGTVVSSPKPTTAIKATRFSCAMAVQLARQTHNGSGEIATALHVTTLLERQITGLRKSADEVEGLPPINS